MSYNLILVDVGFEDTIVHKMNVITGDYLSPTRLKGNFNNQLQSLIDLIIIDRPDKIIFDKSGVGYGFYSMFDELVKIEYPNVFTVDAFGLITYKGDNDDEGKL